MEQNLKKNDYIENKAELDKKAIHKKRVQIISLAVFALFLIVGTIAAIPIAKELSADLKTHEGIQNLTEKFSRYSGIWGVIVFLLIQTIQVILAVIPPIQILGGVMFGWFWGGVLSYAGVFLGNFIVFMLVKRLGAPLVDAFVNEKQLKRFKFLQDEKKLTGILIILYLIPGVPKDVITYIVPLTQISKKDFFLYVMPFRIPAVFMSTILGGNVGNGNYRAAFGIIIAFIAIGVIGVLFKDVILNKLKRNKKAD